MQPSPKVQPMEYESVVDSEEEQLLEEVIETEENDYGPQTLGEKIQQWRKNRKQNVVTETQEQRKTVPAFNPEALVNEHTPLEDLIEARVSVQKLQAANFFDRILSSEFETATLWDLHENGYSLRDVQKLIPHWNDLKKCGFNKEWLSDHWHIDTLAMLYDIPKNALCQELGFTMMDFIKSRTTPDGYKALNIDADNLVKMQIGFPHLFCLRMDLEDMTRCFGFTKEHFFALNLDKEAIRALAVTRNWNRVAYAKHLGLDEDELAKIGMSMNLTKLR